MSINVTCRNCSHVFLSYSGSCPECGWKRRRRTKNSSAFCALIVSALAIGGNCQIVMEYHQERSAATAAPRSVTLDSKSPTRSRLPVLNQGQLARSAASTAMNSAVR